MAWEEMTAVEVTTMCTEALVSCHHCPSCQVCAMQWTRVALVISCSVSCVAMFADLLPDNPYDTMNQGCDFLRNHQSPSVDFATIHLWPDSWLTNVDDEKRVQFARRWINCHVDVCTQLLRKPLVLAEFGWKLDGRAAYYDKVSCLAT